MSEYPVNEDPIFEETSDVPMTVRRGREIPFDFDTHTLEDYRRQLAADAAAQTAVTIVTAHSSMAGHATSLGGSKIG